MKRDSKNVCSPCLRDLPIFVLLAIEPKKVIADWVKMRGHPVVQINWSCKPMNGEELGRVAIDCNLWHKRTISSLSLFNLLYLHNSYESIWFGERKAQSILTY